MRRRPTQVESEALEQIDLEHVLGSEGVDYKMVWGRSGRQLNVRSCPFCGNNKYKVYVNAETGLGNCFAGSCQQGTFNKWLFLKALYDLTPQDLKVKINRLAVEQGWRPRPVAATRYEPGALEMPDNQKIADLYAMPRYLLERGVDADLADYFDLRWSENGVFKVKTPDGKTVQQDYSNRILIPIYDMHGKMVSFQGRDTTGKSEKRYLFPPMYASTGSHLYNINNWEVPMDTVVISEGVFDVVAVKRALRTDPKRANVLPVGSFGMHFSVNPNTADDQLSKLLALKQRGLRRVIFLWDNEAKALEAAVEAANVVRRYGFKVYIAQLGASNDPGEASDQEILTALDNLTAINSDLAGMLLLSH